MGDGNHIRTLRDYSRPSHEGYKNTIELPRREQCGASSIRHHPTRFKDLLQKVPHHGIDLWLQVQIFYDHANPATRRTIDQSVGGKLRDRNAEESWALLEDLSLYDNKSWNDPRDFAKPVKAITLPQDVPSTSDRRLIELENQVQRFMEAHLALTQPTQVNRITTPCEICSGPYDTQYCMEDPEQAFVENTPSRTDEAGGNGYSLKDKNKAKTNKTEHGNGKSVKSTDISKNHKKTVKNGQARTRESEEYKKKPKIQSRSQKSQASFKSRLEQYLKGSHNRSRNGAHVIDGRSTKRFGFALDPLTKLAQQSYQRMTMLAILSVHKCESTSRKKSTSERKDLVDD
ncbi:hypothetical protein Tco_1475160 [Tanacetum coccineum]